MIEWCAKLRAYLNFEVKMLKQANFSDQQILRLGFDVQLWNVAANE